MTDNGDDGQPGRYRAGHFFGRRRGKTLRRHQAGLVETLLPRLLIETDGPAPQTIDGLFPEPCRDFRLEIGFGGGEHLLGEAVRQSEIGFIGVEPFVNGMAKALSALDEAGIGNVRLFDRDAAILLDWLPAATFARVDLLYPDPWPKPRHWKRRFVSDANLDRIARVLKPGGEFRFASDIDTYVDWTLLHVQRRRDLVWTAATADDWRLPWSGWPGTRYEAKAFREGRTPAYLIFRRV
jgi:tRNA (guanine-N7-)-methyltransferase